MFGNRNRDFLRYVVANEASETQPAAAGGAGSDAATPSTEQTSPPAPVPATEPPADESWDPARAQEKIRKQNQENASLRAAKKAAEEAALTAADRAKELEQTAARVPDLEAQLLRT